MSGTFQSRGFFGKRRQDGPPNRVPPGQYVTNDFPVLSAGPTPRTPLERWNFEINGLVRQPVRWSWAEFQLLPSQHFTVDIHCVTKWSKLDTQWEGVSVDTLLASVEVDPNAHYVARILRWGIYHQYAPKRDYGWESIYRLPVQWCSPGA